MIILCKLWRRRPAWDWWKEKDGDEMQKEVYARRGVMKRSVHRGEADPGLVMTQEDIERFIEVWQEKGCMPATLERYRHSLNRLYDALPADKRIHRGTLAGWQEKLTQSGLAPNTVNLIMSVCNSWLDFMDGRQYQHLEQVEAEEKLQPELTRSEYLKLLEVAKVKNKERVYLLIKLFATTGIHVQELPKVTVEAVKNGKLVTTASGIKQTVRLPQCLQQELLSYAKRKGIEEGTIFITRRGTPIIRTNITTSILQLSEFVQVPKDKINPRCLRKLYQTTRANVEANIAMLVEQAMERQLEEEQLSVGWDV